MGLRVFGFEIGVEAGEKNARTKDTNTESERIAASTEREETEKGAEDRGW